MKYQTKLVIQCILRISLISILLLSCSKKKNEMKFVIEGKLINEKYNYSFNPYGFINTPYGRVNIETQSYYKNEKLVNLEWNRPNGFLPYSIEYLRNDPKLYKSFKIDSIFSKEKEKILEYKTKIIRNDTVFYRENEKIMIIRQPPNK